MGRLLLCFVLIANLLACPLRCVSCTASMPVDTEASSCCCCSHDCDSESEPAIPMEVPPEPCTCQDCICEGATLQDAPKCPEAASFVVFDVCDQTTQASRNRQLSGIEPFSSAPLLGGRDMRIAHQSLLN